MQDGKCSSCGASTVFSKPDGIGFGNHRGVFVHTSAMTQSSSTLAFLCTTCGLFETHVVDPAKLAQVAKTWQREPRP